VTPFAAEQNRNSSGVVLGGVTYLVSYPDRRQLLPWDYFMIARHPGAIRNQVLQTDYRYAICRDQICFPICRRFVQIASGHDSRGMLSGCNRKTFAMHIGLVLRHTVAYLFRYLSSSSIPTGRSAVSRICSSLTRSKERRTTTRMSHRIKVQFFSASHSLGGSAFSRESLAPMQSPIPGRRAGFLPAEWRRSPTAILRATCSRAEATRSGTERGHIC